MGFLRQFFNEKKIVINEFIFPRLLGEQYNINFYDISYYNYKMTYSYIASVFGKLENYQLPFMISENLFLKLMDTEYF